MNRLTAITLCIFMAGCVGSATPHNPMERAKVNEPWWQATTAGVAKKDNPWEKFVLEHTVKDTSDPWGSYEQPKLFPEGWKPRNYLNPDQEQKLENIKLRLEDQMMRKAVRRLLQPVEKEAPRKKTFPERLRDLQEREKEYFERSI